MKDKGFSFIRGRHDIQGCREEVSKSSGYGPILEFACHYADLCSTTAQIPTTQGSIKGRWRSPFSETFIETGSGLACTGELEDVKPRGQKSTLIERVSGAGLIIEFRAVWSLGQIERFCRICSGVDVFFGDFGWVSAGRLNPKILSP